MLAAGWMAAEYQSTALTTASKKKWLDKLFTLVDHLAGVGVCQFFVYEDSFSPIPVSFIS
jgi:hypothetical protein